MNIKLWAYLGAAIFFFGVPAMEHPKSRLKRELIEASRKVDSFSAQAECVRQYFEVIGGFNAVGYLPPELGQRHDTCPFDMSSFRTIFYNLHRVSQGGKNCPPCWHYEQYPQIIAAAKRLKKQIEGKNSEKPNEFSEERLQEVDAAIQMIKQFNTHVSLLAITGKT